jgi:hypothetical protein
MFHRVTSIGLYKRISVLFVVGSVFLISSTTAAIAGGLYINEFGTSAMGTAGAGAHAYANDASTAFHNPAGMTRIEGRQLSAGAPRAWLSLLPRGRSKLRVDCKPGPVPTSVALGR